MSAVDFLLESLDRNIDYFNTTRYNVLCDNLCAIRSTINTCSRLFHCIRQFASQFDFDDQTPANGYRSFVDVFDIAVEKTSKICNRLTATCKSFWFRANNFSK